MNDLGTNAGPLSGIKILDLTIWQSGPFSTVMLSDMGAEVIKVEDRTTGDPGRGFMDAGATSGVSGYFEAMNRNKRSITLDLKATGGRELFYRLAAKVDVVVQNFRFGVAEKLKIAYADLLPHNPSCSICLPNHESAPRKTRPYPQLCAAPGARLRGPATQLR